MAKRKYKRLHYEDRQTIEAMSKQGSSVKDIAEALGTHRDAKTGEKTGKGVFTIVEVKAGQGASAGWGRLKSGAGWISLDYVTRLA